MSFYREQILPRLTDLAFRGEEAARVRARATAGLSGEVLEVGFGSGLTMPFYPPAVTRVRAVEPSAVARKLAADKVAASAVPVDYVGADAQALPLEDATVDHVVSIMTLCSIPDAQRALAEICRVLRPGGAFHFVEHGLSPEETSVRRVLSSGAGEFLVPLRMACEVGFLLRLVPGVPRFRSGPRRSPGCGHAEVPRRG